MGRFRQQGLRHGQAQGDHHVRTQQRDLAVHKCNALLCLIVTNRHTRCRPAFGQAGDIHLFRAELHRPPHRLQQRPFVTIDWLWVLVTWGQAFDHKQPCGLWASPASHRCRFTVAQITGLARGDGRWQRQPVNVRHLNRHTTNQGI